LYFFFVLQDNEMGWTDPETGEYSRCQVKASALNEELGNIQVICTDKTGTLTSNQMELSRCSVGGALFFENDTHRDNHQLTHAQSEAHRERYGMHKLMKQLNATAFARWVSGRDEEGNFVFDHSDDWTDDSNEGEHDADSTDNTPMQQTRSLVSHGAGPSSSQDDAPPGLKPPGKYPSVSATSRDFLLNILLCNGTLPSWKAQETPATTAVGAKKDNNSSGAGAKDPSRPAAGSVAAANGVVAAVCVPGVDSPDEAAPLASSRSQDAISPPLVGSGAVAEPLSPVSRNQADLAQKADEQRRNMKLVFESQSPDEIALLQAAQRVGATFTQRSGNKLTVEINLPAGHPASPRQPDSAGSAGSSPDLESSPLGELEPRDIPLKPFESRVSLTYTVLAELEFASAWRRNSVVIRGPDGALKLFTKGADTTIAALIDHSDRRQQELLQLVMAQATEFAATGSRTLLFASRPLQEAEFERWWPVYDAAQNAFADRDKRIEQAFTHLEHGMWLLGCSAVDDQLQELVPQTVDFLLAAKMQIIVLTGDKQETGVEIAKQSHLIKPGFEVLYLAGTSAADVEVKMRKLIEGMNTLKELHNLKHGIGAHTAVAGVDDGSAPNKLGLAPVAGALDDPRRIESVKFHEGVDEDLEAGGGVKVPASSAPPQLGFALAVDGVALELALLYHRELFMQIFVAVETVVSYRSTPMQKALVVRLMKETGKTCLAIGDGANDCSMISEAHGTGTLCPLHYSNDPVSTAG
jgi:magnesium-transporting ATPase (P-type)